MLGLRVQAWGQPLECAMNKLFAKPLRSGLIAAGLIVGLVMPLIAGPMPQPGPIAPASENALLQVRDSTAGGGTSMNDMIWRRNHGSHHWRGNQRHWRGDQRHWRGNRHHWRGDRYWRYRHHRNHYRGSGLYFGLGVVPGYYYGTRHTYRSGSAHVRWCYNRYRSYRAWDNTYQPYNGPRRQCRSPY